MEKGSPAVDLAALPLYCLTLPRPVAQAVVRIGWPLPAFKSPGEACVIAVHAGAQYDFQAARRIENQTGHTMPSRERAEVGIVGVGRWDGARLVDLQPVPAFFAKGAPGLWRLPAAEEQEVRRRYAAAQEKALGAARTSGPAFPWGDT